MKTKNCLFGFLLMFAVLIAGSFYLPDVSDQIATENEIVAFADMTEESGGGETGGGEEAPTDPVEQPEERYKVSVSVVGKGEVLISPNEEDFLKGTVVNVEVVPQDGWTLSSLEGVELDEENNFQIEENVTIVATFVANPIRLEDSESWVIIETTAEFVPVGTTLSVSKLQTEDPRYVQVKNRLSNPNQLVVYEITLKDGEDQALGQLGGNVKLKIKLDETFDASKKVNVSRFVLDTNENIDYGFAYEDGYVVIETNNLGFYTLSQNPGFKPASPSKDGTNKMTITLIVVGVSAVVAAIAVAVAVIVNRKKKY